MKNKQSTRTVLYLLCLVLLAVGFVVFWKTSHHDNVGEPVSGRLIENPIDGELEFVRDADGCLPSLPKVQLDGGTVYAFCVGGHEYLESVKPIYGGYGGGGGATNCVIHSRSCLCHQGKEHGEVVVASCSWQEIYDDVWILHYNGFDYLLEHDLGAGLVPIPGNGSYGGYSSDVATMASSSRRPGQGQELSDAR